MPVPSAQVKTAIILAGLRANGATWVFEPIRCRDHTERMLAYLGAPLQIDAGRILVQPGRDVRPGTISVPGDISSAAFFIAAATLLPGSELIVSDVGLNPTRKGMLDTIMDAGASVEVEREDTICGEPVATLIIRHSPLAAFSIGADHIPLLVDEVPMLAVMATQATGTSRIEGVDELRHKESDRLVAITEALARMGAESTVEGDTLIIEGPQRLRGAQVDTRGDHRIAMALAVAGLVADGETMLGDTSSVEVSYPHFFDDLQRLRVS